MADGAGLALSATASSSGTAVVSRGRDRVAELIQPGLSQECRTKAGAGRDVAERT